MSLPTFDVDVCNGELGALLLPVSLIALAECDSTNTQLMRLAEEGALSGTVLVADHQSAGRGRRNRQWMSTPQGSLTFSLLWRFVSSSDAPTALSLAVGLGLQRAMAALGVAAAVKWPNDLLCRDRKLAGVLIETQTGDVKSAVIGIGINISLPATLPGDIARAAISLDEVLPTAPTRERLLGKILAHLLVVLEQYGREGFAVLREEWQARHAFENRDIRVGDGNDDLCGICLGVSATGELLVRVGDRVHRVVSGDVSLRPT